MHIFAVVIEPLAVSRLDCHIAHETAFERIGFCRVVIAVVAQDAELAHIEDDVRSEAVADFFGSLRAVDILDGMAALRTDERRPDVAYQAAVSAPVGFKHINAFGGCADAYIAELHRLNFRGLDIDLDSLICRLGITPLISEADFNRAAVPIVGHIAEIPGNRAHGQEACGSNACRGIQRVDDAVLCTAVRRRHRHRRAVSLVLDTTRIRRIELQCVGYRVAACDIDCRPFVSRTRGNAVRIECFLAEQILRGVRGIAECRQAHCTRAVIERGAEPLGNLGRIAFECDLNFVGQLVLVGQRDVDVLDRAVSVVIRHINGYLRHNQVEGIAVDIAREPVVARGCREIDRTRIPDYGDCVLAIRVKQLHGGSGGESVDYELTVQCLVRVADNGAGVAHRTVGVVSPARIHGRGLRRGIVHHDGEVGLALAVKQRLSGSSVQCAHKAVSLEEFKQSTTRIYIGTFHKVARLD